jgi:hypothetical protein
MVLEYEDAKRATSRSPLQLSLYWDYARFNAFIRRCDEEGEPPLAPTNVILWIGDAKKGKACLAPTKMARDYKVLFKKRLGRFGTCPSSYDKYQLREYS